MSVVAGLATMFEIAVLNLILPLTEHERAFILSCILAPITEEMLKPMGLIYCKGIALMLKARDWLVMGSLAGLGFGVLENSIYSLQAIARGGERAALAVIIYRTFTSLPMHMITSSIAGMGMGLILSKKFRFIAPLLYFMAVIIHAAYNLRALGF